MRFDIRNDNAMFVDNVYQDVDTSALPSDVWRVSWLETEGYIHFLHDTRKQKIVDPSPYQPFLNSWCTARLSPALPDEPPLTLTEAKSIKIELINYLYDLKRQAPYAHTVAAGTFSWEATDAAVAAMSIATLPALLGGTSGTGNSLVTQINTQNAAVVTKVNGQNTSLVNQINTNVVPIASGLSTQINSNIVTAGNNGFGNINAQMSTLNNNADIFDNFITYFNTYIMGYVGDGQNTLNNRLQQTVITYGPPEIDAAPGLTGTLASSGANFGNVATNPYAMNTVAASSSNITSSPITTDPITPGSGPGAATLQWTPLGQANPVTLTVTEMSDIMIGMANRRASLLTVKVNKTAAVNALTTTAAVIAYDATTGWP